MRDRLIELVKQGSERCVDHIDHCEDCIGYGKGNQCINFVIANYLFEQGVIAPPCGVDYKTLYEQLLEDFESAMYFAGKNNNVCNFCEHDCGEGGTCKGRENWIYCTPKWRGVVAREEAEQALKGEHHA